MSTPAPVQRLAGITWNPVASRYQRGNGRFIAQSDVLEVLEGQVTATGERMRALGERLQAGQTSLAEWQIAMAEEIKSAHLLAGALESGGFAQLNRSDLGWLGARIREQYQFLANFAREIETGAQPLDGRILARSDLYAAAARATQREAARRRGRLAGHRFERNQLGPADHCRASDGKPGCIDEARKGWVPIGTLAPIGSRRCSTRCRCTIVTRAEEPAA